MPKVKFFTEPEDYRDYLFWRAQHRHKAIYVMLGAAAFALGQWL